MIRFREDQLHEVEKTIQQITNKEVLYAIAAPEWVQDYDSITVPAGDLGGLLHEFAHWVVAAEDERAHPNLFLDEWEGQTKAQVIEAAERRETPAVPQWVNDCCDTMLERAGYGVQMRRELEATCVHILILQGALNCTVRAAYRVLYETTINPAMLYGEFAGKPLIDLRFAFKYAKAQLHKLPTFPKLLDAVWRLLRGNDIYALLHKVISPII